MQRRLLRAPLTLFLVWCLTQYYRLCVCAAACATGNYCITNAADHISRGDADLMLAGD